jgi:SAM-dependent methyltransferase
MMDIQAQEQLLEHRQIWGRKPVLRRIYREEFFARMLLYRKKQGFCVEVGGGPGYFKESFADVVSTDVVWCPWLDVVADAQKLPFETRSITNLFGLDVLHHLAVPMEFLQEVQRVLTPGGRLILVEPWITPFSYLIYRYFHQEECHLSARPWDLGPALSQLDKKAFDGNQAVPYLLFGPKHLARTVGSLPGMTPVVIETFSLFAYLLSFGFKPMNLLPEFLYPVISTLERTTSVVWRRLAALRVLIVMEKAS